MDHLSLAAKMDCEMQFSRPFIAVCTLSMSALQQLSANFFTVSVINFLIWVSFSCILVNNFCLLSADSFSLALSPSISRYSTFSLFLERSAAWVSLACSSASCAFLC